MMNDTVTSPLGTAPPPPHTHTQDAHRAFPAQHFGPDFSTTPPTRFLQGQGSQNIAVLIKCVHLRTAICRQSPSTREVHMMGSPRPVSEPAGQVPWGGAFQSSPHRPLRKAFGRGAHTVLGWPIRGLGPPSWPPLLNRILFSPWKGTEQSQHLEVLTKDGAALAPTRFPLGASQGQIFRWIEKETLF